MLEEFFAGQDVAGQLFIALYGLVESVGAFDVRVTKSQVAFRRRRAFAWAWMPGKYLHGAVAPLVLTVALPSRDPSPRWKQVVEPQPGHYIHHLELRSASELDDQVSGWLQEAWQHAA